jgi:protein ImuB
MFAVIYIPDFFLQSVLRANPGMDKRPVVLIDDTQKKPQVLQLTATARRAGIVEGMSSTQALARCTGVSVKSRSVAQESAATDALLQCGFSVSPNIEATAEGVCTIDLTGLVDIDWEELARAIVERVSLLHLTARVGIAENPLLALHAARAAAPCRVIIDSKEFLRALPVESIGPSFDVLGILRKWGIHTVGQFVALGKEPLSARLGPEALELYDRATASSTRPLRLARVPEAFEESIQFEHEIETIEPLLFVLRRFLEQLLVRLQMMYWVAQELRLELRFESGAPYAKTFPIPAPTSNVETLFRMLHTHLETMRTEQPIVGLHLSAKAGRPINHQFGLFESVLRDPNHFHETLARLTALVGADHVGTPMVEESHRPDAFRMEPVNLQEEGRARCPERAENSNEPLPRGLALHRFRPPLAAEVQMNDTGPIFIKSTVLEGAIRDCRGPWRSSGRWWDTQRWSRDEWDVQAANGRLYRLCSDGERWFVEGIYD